MPTSAQATAPLAPNMTMDLPHAVCRILEETGITSPQSILDIEEMLSLGQSINTDAARYLPAMRGGRLLNIKRRSR